MTAHSGTRIALTALQQLLLARIWGPKDFGTFVLITSFVDLVVIALDPRSQDPIVKYCSEFDARGEKEKALALAGVGFVKNIATAAACGLLVWALAGWGAQTIVHWSEATPLILLYAASYLPFSVRNAGAGVLISRGLFRVLALLGIAG
ncbi:MAG: hypothetical protein NZ959_02565, partial [Armatimonadetes bacterium]|nr:hypothetical protein [Armatimonadota bacterium]